MPRDRGSNQESIGKRSRGRNQRRPPAASSPAKPKANVSRRISNSLVALSSAAILSVYGIGYVRTQAAENQITAFQGQASTIVLATPTADAPVITLPTVPAFLDIKPVRTSTAVPTTSPSANATQPGVVATMVVPPTAIPYPTATAVAVASKYKDGTFVGMGFSRHGNIQATVVIKRGKIVSAAVSQCYTRYRCSYVLPLVDEVISTQAPPVDAVSGATDSSEAYLGAIEQALSQAS